MRQNIFLTYTREELHHLCFLRANDIWMCDLKNMMSNLQFQLTHLLRGTGAGKQRKDSRKFMGGWEREKKLDSQGNRK